MNKDFSKIISDGLNAAQASTELFLSDKKVNIVSHIKKELVSLVLYFLSFLMIIASLGYLLLFSAGRLLVYLKVESLYFGPVYAAIILLVGLSYLIFSLYVKSTSRLEVVNKAEKTLETSKQDLSEIKGSLLRWFNKYKIIFLMGLITYLFYLVRRTPKVSQKRRRILKNQILGLDKKSVIDDMKGIIVTVLLLLVKEFIEQMPSKSVAPTSPQ